VLEPLSGYLLLAQRLYENGAEFASGWNFGPPENDAQPVQWLVESLCTLWGDEVSWQLDKGDHPHEAHYLKLDCSKAHAELNWNHRWGLEKALESIVAWARVYQKGADLRLETLRQIEDYLG
jgi:CDP-glucose 4,6-dehydratase